MDFFIVAGFFLSIAFVALFAFFLILVFTAWSFIFGAGFDATPEKIIRKMLQMTELKKGEVLYDLGCGTGRSLIIGAKEFGAYGIGIEINPLLCWWAKIKIKSNFLSDKIKVQRANFFKIPISQADVIFIFLYRKANEKLVAKFKKELKPGTRIVSYHWKLPGINLVKSDKKNNIYVYKI